LDFDDILSPQPYTNGGQNHLEQTKKRKIFKFCDSKTFLKEDIEEILKEKQNNADL